MINNEKQWLQIYEWDKLGAQKRYMTALEPFIIETNKFLCKEHLSLKKVLS